MQIKFENTNTIVDNAAKEAANNAVVAEFKATKELQAAEPNFHTTQVNTIAQPVIGKVNSPLAGSPSEVFAKAGVISISEPTRATLTFESEHAAFKNTLVMYKLDANGQFKETQVIFPNASTLGSDGQLLEGRSAVHINLAAGDQVGFGLLPNGFSNPLSKQLLTRPDGQLGFVNWKGEPANLLTDNPNAIQLVHIDNFGHKQPINGEFGNKMFNSVGNVSQGLVTNFDGNDHADQLVDADRGLILIGMDDLPRGEDAIRKNVLFSVDVGKNNASALNQNLVDDRPTTFRDMAGADFKASHAEIMATARMYDEDGDGKLNAQEWAKFAPLLNLTQDDHKHFVGMKGRGDLDSLSYMLQRGDVSGDGQIDEREVLDLSRRLNGNNPSVIQSFREAAGIDWKLDYEEFISTAEHHDKNGDGLDQQEWNRFAPVLGLTPQDRNLFLKPSGQFDVGKFTSVFALADTNGSGQLNPREVLELRRIVHENFAPTPFPVQQQQQFPGGSSVPTQAGGFARPFMQLPDNSDALAEQLMKVAMGPADAETAAVEQPDALATVAPEQVVETPVAQNPVAENPVAQNSFGQNPVVQEQFVSAPETSGLQSAEGRSFRRQQEEANQRFFR
jgi:Ca2+-binding EF-hand superfamily protein